MVYGLPLILYFLKLSDLGGKWGGRCWKRRKGGHRGWRRGRRRGWSWNKEEGRRKKKR
ncbi:hypothetical protein RchiOBHm_Chr4g0418231 [Rosa chinensis]|uniref:Uncharacterized protein n=1 Tax=Rosa chinensis TaxID=74649 RepID=A0A2P6QXA7_ROSCH|nr:hypothetical protein RchiOBHm_Chr4g0418231 [Rosa chinensis]